MNDDYRIGRNRTCPKCGKVITAFNCMNCVPEETGLRSIYWPAARQAPYAAGPWRYDVENIPQDGTRVMIACDRSLPNSPLIEYHCVSRMMDDVTGEPYWGLLGKSPIYISEHANIIAFATISPPEIKT